MVELPAVDFAAQRRGEAAEPPDQAPGQRGEEHACVRPPAGC
jgi:hypothetical protein